jgi:hypothetical protein
MANAAAFGATFLADVASLVDDLESLRTLSDRVAQDASLVTNYTTSVNPRADLAATDFTNAVTAIGQLLSAFDNGAPSQKSYLFKML